ncbi:hypothetical protein LG201_12610 [Methylobacillus gramineus]|uniref:hypothetical protein n=1 Tax=Methylobacillus gramineus TaxID=755169 RepID=UPI001CFF8B2C|nr:hypothetical protein [Methylobacillus gramineus]MCB5186048.1 hypothetical protein [Methylobacillus gramineus]
MLKIAGLKHGVMACVILVLGAMSLPIMAADKDKASKQQERRMRQMMQQVQAEKDQLQSQFEQEKVKLQEEAKAQEQKNVSLQINISSANRKRTELENELETLRKQKSELEGLQNNTVATLEATQHKLEDERELNAKSAVERKEMQALLVKKQQQLNASNEKNARLYDFGLQLIRIYERPSVYQQAMRDEPFTQLKRVELENILQDYRDKIDEQKVTVNTQ